MQYDWKNGTAAFTALSHSQLQPSLEITVGQQTMAGQKWVLSGQIIGMPVHTCRLVVLHYESKNNTITFTAQSHSQSQPKLEMTAGQQTMSGQK